MVIFAQNTEKVCVKERYSPLESGNFTSAAR